MEEFRFCAEKRPKLAEFRKALRSNREDRPMVDGAEGGTGSDDTREQTSLVRINERVEARAIGACVQSNAGLRERCYGTALLPTAR